MTTETCGLCDRGVGHEIDMIGFDVDPDRGNICVTKCRSCRKVLTFEATEECECCDHRYVGKTFSEQRQIAANMMCLMNLTTGQTTSHRDLSVLVHTFRATVRHFKFWRQH